MDKIKQDVETQITSMAGLAIGNNNHKDGVIILMKYIALLLLDIREELSELNSRAAKQTRELERQTRMEKRR